MDENIQSVQNKSRMPLVITVVLALLLLGGFAYMMSQKNQQPATQKAAVSPTEAPTATTAPTEAATPSGAMKQGEAKTFTVTAASFSFTPSTIKVKKGDNVKIVFTNSGGMHDFVLDEFNVKTKVIQSGQSETVTFTADKAGTFEYYCSVGNHRAMGMKGSLIVQ